MPSTPSLKNVAETAGVSIATASMVLNNRPGIAPETRSRVIKAAELLGYRLKNQPVAELETHLSVVGLLIKHDFGQEWVVNPFFSRIQLGVVNECRHHKLDLMYSAIEVDRSNNPVAWPEMIKEQRVDGLILAGAIVDDTLDQIRRKTHIPIVLVDSYAHNEDYDLVMADNIRGAQTAICYLMDCGHRHIGLIGWNPASPPSIQQRQVGYLAGLQKGNLEGCVESSELSRAAGFEAAKRLLRRAPDLTAIFACNDDTALGVLHAAQELGMNVPGDLSVIGFDDIDLAGEIKPGLTTLHVHKSWMGSIGVRMLIERARNPDQPHLTTVVSTQLIVRDSVMNLAANRSSRPVKEVKKRI